MAFSKLISTAPAAGDHTGRVGEAPGSPLATAAAPSQLAHHPRRPLRQTRPSSWALWCASWTRGWSLNGLRACMCTCVCSMLRQLPPTSIVILYMRIMCVCDCICICERGSLNIRRRRRIVSTISFATKTFASKLKLGENLEMKKLI